MGFRVFLGLGFKVQGSRLRVETVRLGLIVGLSQVSVGGVWGGGGGGVGVGWGVGPCWEGLQLPLVLANRPLADPGFLGGYPFTKGFWV